MELVLTDRELDLIILALEEYNKQAVSNIGDVVNLTCTRDTALKGREIFKKEYDEVVSLLERLGVKP